MPLPPKPAETDAFDRWFGALEERHLSDLTFQEIRQSIEALSTRYVERRGAALKGALSSRGKRAAFALYYAPLHFLTVRAILRRLSPGAPPEQIFDLGCGTGVAGAAWALEGGARASVAGFDVNAWAVREARWNFRQLGIRGTAVRREVGAVTLDGASAVVAAFTINELSEADRNRALRELSKAAMRGTRVLIVEPISRRPAPWWDEWTAALAGGGGRADEWRLEVDLPDRLRQFDKAAGLRHEVLTARSFFASSYQL